MHVNEQFLRPTHLRCGVRRSTCWLARMNKFRPIFIAGAARSGTTMLGSIIGSSSQCIATPESQFMTDLVAAAGWPGGHLRPGTARTILVRDPRFRIWEVDEAELFDDDEPITTLRDLAERIVQAFAEGCGRSSVEVWVDHTPGSLFIWPYLREAFSEARFIHLVRDGRAVGASILPLDWGPVSIFDAARKWAREVGAGLAAETSSDFRGQVRRVHYEQLVSDPAGTVKDLCRFCDITFDNAILNGKGFLVPAYTREQHALVGSKPQASRATEWKSKLSSRQIEIFEAEAGGLLQLLGYSTLYWPAAEKQNAYEKWSARLRKLAVAPYNRARHKRRRGHVGNVAQSAGN